MGKGSSPSGSTTTTTTNPTQQAQLPYLQSGWNAAQGLYNQTPVNIAPVNPYQTQGYYDVYNAAGNLNNTLLPQSNAAFSNAVTGGMGLANSPAAPYFNQFAQGTTAPQQQFGTIGQAAQDLTGPGMAQLAASASGQYLNQNPYIAAAVKAAQDPVTRQYQTATAPQTDANFAGAGRYGSGALLGARGQNEQNLGKALGDISTNMYNADYGRERQLQDTAAQQYGVLRDRGLQLGLDAARQALAGQQYGAGQLQSGYQAGNQAALEGLRLSPQQMQQQLYPAQSQITDLAAMRALDQEQRDAPWKTLSQYLNSIGQPTSGSGSTTSPYFQNQTANTLSALSGAGSLASSLGGGGGLGGLGGLFGGGAGAGIGAFAPEVSGAAAESLLSTALPAAFLDASGGTGIATLASAAPIAAAGGWIVCTELKRQGKMPPRHWAAGIALFATYPERTKRGYYLWAIPTVRHLRAHPNSRFARFIGNISRWRAENIAANRGVRGARWRLRGAIVTAIGYPLCATLGYFVAPQDWEAVYRQERIS